ncbi:GNAT family N-acetyltransferase [Citricoccus sp. SGAir0253]|uniref:GNAT family N-acetyltransferase n=1 Tax=Citricoccus sp. SGAir0253 TaxID=2567881 RepID=UPI0010CD4E67|nr:GNAT family N-acetyltransferase [Citricoccus sp. SGAir0253]QCU78967.1 GNAT family N-acetyltransferase [Citricoccus sp. SGAir0253]
MTPTTPRPTTAADPTTQASATPPGAPRFAFRPVRPAEDAALLHAWTSPERARFWGLTGASMAEVRAEHERLAADPHHRALLALDRERGDRPAFLLETYDPAHSVLAGRYAWQHGDAGLHLLLPDPAQAGGAEPGFSAAALEASLEHVFADPAVLRVVVEPDARNTAIQALNARCGFRPVGRIELPADGGAPAKTAQLSFCTRVDFAAATGRPSGAVAHLDPARWAAANRHVTAKAIAEFSHERLLAPVPDPDAQPEAGTGTGAAAWLLEGPGMRYRFRARRHALDHWDVDAGSLTCERRTEGPGWTEEAPDAQRFVTAFRDVLGISAAQLPVYLEEVGSTLASHCYKQLHSTATAAELAAGTGDPVADFQRLEAAMTEGHPCFVANNGRLGLGAEDYLALAPETGSALPLEWVAAHRSRARFTAVDGLDLDQLLAAELGPGLREAFRSRLAAACARTGLDPEEFLPLPVHPWQWRNRLSVTFAADVATGHLVHLGPTEDLYQPQQSIRTFLNRTRPERHYVKTALSVLNMGFLRGLSAAYMESTPAINDWLAGLFADDPELDPERVQLIREVAAVGYSNPLFHEATDRHSPYRKMLAALWRESPATRIGPGEDLATMASLLHVDRHGTPFVAELVRRSGLGAEDWLGRYLEAYLVPLVHCLVRHDLVFMPHGENVILVLREGVPVRVLLKDLAEEVVVLGDRTDLPPEVERLRAEVADEDHGLSVLTDIVDCFLRFLAPLLVREGLVTEERFWAVVAGRLTDYRARHPESAERFDSLGLLAPAFRLSCLNRLQLRNNQQMIDLADPAGSLAYAGELENPIAAAAEATAEVTAGVPVPAGAPA